MRGNRISQLCIWVVGYPLLVDVRDIGLIGALLVCKQPSHEHRRNLRAKALRLRATVITRLKTSFFRRMCWILWVVCMVWTAITQWMLLCITRTFLTSLLSALSRSLSMASVCAAVGLTCTNRSAVLRVFYLAWIVAYRTYRIHTLVAACLAHNSCKSRRGSYRVRHLQEGEMEKKIQFEEFCGALHSTTWQSWTNLLRSCSYGSVEHVSRILYTHACTCITILLMQLP